MKILFILLLHHIVFLGRNCEAKNAWQCYTTHNYISFPFDDKFEINKASNEYSFTKHQKEENVKILWAEDFHHDQFPSDVEDRYPNLNEIVIGLKNEFNILNNNFFDNVTYKSVKKLNIIQGCATDLKYLDEVNFDFLDNFSDLEELKVQEFKFGTIEKVKFGRKLKVLYMRNNKIKSVRGNIFLNLKNLEELDFCYNEISTLCEKLFKNNPKLQKVFFKSNEIKVIPQKLFSGLNELNSVDLSWNKLKYLPADLFKNNRKLKDIYLNNNQIEKLHPDIFIGITLEWREFTNNPCFGLNRDGNLENCYSEWDNLGPPSVDDEENG